MSGEAPKSDHFRWIDSPDALQEPSQLSWVLHTYQRKFNIFRQLAFAPEAVSGLCLSIATVAAIGTTEGIVLSKRGAVGRVGFALRYGVAQILPSIIWASKSADLVCRNMGLDAAKILIESVKVSSRAQGRVHWLQTARSIFAGFVGIAHILRLVEVAGLADEKYLSNVQLGKEPLLPGVNERVVRLAGRTSDVTQLSLQRLGCHIVPVFEQPAAVETLVQQTSRGGRFPVYWHIPSGQYSDAQLWEGFRISPEWLTPVSVAKGAFQRRVLIVEADASVGEEALALGLSEEENDLEIAEAGQAFVVLRRKVAALRCEGASVARIFLANLQLPVLSGAGKATDRREVLEMYNEADVILDATLPLVKEIYCWLERVHKIDPCSGNTTSSSVRRVVFETKNQKYFAAMKATLKEHGWSVVDQPAVRSFSDLKLTSSVVVPEATEAGGGNKEKKTLKNVSDLYIVYEKTTSDTVHQVRQLIRAGLSPDRILALLDRHAGVSELEALAEELSEERGNDHLSPVKLEYVCSAEVYDSLFAEVRRKIRAGESYADIQRWADTNNTLPVRRTIDPAATKI